MIFLLALLYSAYASGFFDLTQYEELPSSTQSPASKKVQLRGKGRSGRAEIQRQTDYLRENVAICPQGGFYFKRDFAHSLPEVCYLCFCNETGNSLCWPRDNRKCDANHYVQHNIVKRQPRKRRSPLSLTDIFMRDATRDVFNKQTAEQCKPHEASYSEGCPPADWCTGCTVCDCDANGRWDCHLLSFCSEDDKKKKKKKNKGKVYIQRTLDNEIPPGTPPPGAPNNLARKQVQNLAKYIAKHGPLKHKGKRNKKVVNKTKNISPDKKATTIKSKVIQKNNSQRVTKSKLVDKKVQKRQVKKQIDKKQVKKQVDKKQVKMISTVKTQQQKNISEKTKRDHKKASIVKKNPIVKNAKQKSARRSLPNKVQVKRSPENPKNVKAVVKPTRQAPISDQQPSKKASKGKPKRPKRRDAASTLPLTTAPPQPTTCNPKEAFKRDFDPGKIAAQMRTNLQQKVLAEVQKALATQQQQQEKIVQKRAAPIVKKGIVKKSIQDENKSNKTTPMKRSIKKISKINVEKSNKVKLHRHRRSAADNKYLASAKTNSPYVIPLQKISHDFTPSLNTESMQTYYKYSLDNFTNNALPVNEEYLTEIIYNRTASSKRSVDKQVEHLSNLTVVNLLNGPNDTSVLVRSINETKNISNSTEKSTTIVVKVTDVKPLPMVDKRVVVIDEPHSLINDTTTVKGDEIGGKLNVNVTEVKESVLPVNYTNLTTLPIKVPNLEAPSQTVKPIHKDLKNNDTLKVTESSSVSLRKPSGFVTPVMDVLKVRSMLDKKVVVVKEHDVKENFTETTTKQIFQNPTSIGISESKYKTDVKFESGVISQPNVTEPLQKITTENYLKTEYKLEENTILRGNNSKIEQNTTTPGKEILTKPVTENSVKYETDDIISLKQEIAKLKKLRKHKKAKARNKIMKQIEGDKKADLKLTVNKSKHDDQKSVNNVVHTGTEVRNDSFLNAIDINNVKLNDWIERHTGLKQENHSQVIKISDENLDKLKLNTEQYDMLKPLTAFPALKKKVNTYDLKKINVKSKRRKLTKLVATLHNRTGNDKYFLGDPSALVNNIKNTTRDIKGFFKNLLGGFNTKKQAKKKSRRNRFKVIKYLQKFFKKLFSEVKHKKSKNMTNQFNKDTVIESLCATFGPCNINIKNKAKLQPQIDHLNFETYQMLRSIKIIKGLLKLVELDKNITKSDKSDKAPIKPKSKKAIFKSDVQKLHAILKDEYLDKQHLDKLSDTQKIQIEYIKSNTQNFIQSAAKFAVVLNDIIDVITTPDHKSRNKKGEATREEHKNNIKVVKDVRNERKRVIKSINNSKNVSNLNEPVSKLKDLISKYSMIQNTFMRKIYRVLTNLDTKDRKLINAPTNVAKMIVQNKTEEIQVYTKNIIQNLRKLKNLAQNLNGGLRKKRELRDDDSIEYFLMLIEYLLKQNHPLDTAPVNDGIDLLIEAIKSAPDIKPIKKKVLLAANTLNSINNRNLLNTFNTKLLRNYTASTTVKESAEANLSREDSASDYNRISKEDNYTSNMEDTKDNTIDHSVDEDDVEDKMVLNRRVYTAAPIVTETERIIYTEPRRVPVTKLYITTARTSVRQTMPPRRPVVTDITVRETKVPIERLNNSSERADDGKFDPFNADLEEDISGTLIDSDVTTSTRISIPMIETTTDVTQKMKYKHINDKNEDASMSLSKSRIDWLDETYEEEIKSELNMSATTEAVKGNQRLVTKLPVKINDISGFSKEIIEEGQTMKRGKAQDVLYRKQMDLLNSLDYGAEKSENDNSDSKESNSEDKYSGDAFSSYELNQ